MNWQAAVEKTITGLGYELVGCERTPAGLLRAYIDRMPGASYPTGESELVTVDDCELCTRQLQYVLEVEGTNYARLEVSSPGLDRPLTKPEHYARFAGEQVALTLKLPFQGRKKYDGLLRAGAAEGQWELVFRDGTEDRVLGFTLDEVREARLVPVVDFKGRRNKKPAALPEQGAPMQEPGGLEE
jgi:ribosome maturation factor RimP